MIKKVFKYNINEAKTMLPVGALVLKVALQNDNLCLWALVDPEVKGHVEREFQVYPTGYEIEEPYKHSYLETIFRGDMVFHVFEVL